MTIASTEIQKLKARGILAQKTAGYFTVRLSLHGGHVPADKLQAIARIAQRHGCGAVHLTARQGMEIPAVPADRVAAVEQELAEAGLASGGTGPRVRGIIACPGISCRSGLIDTQAMAAWLGEEIGGYGPLPHKFKIAITGCPNSCVKPRENDVGIAGWRGGTYKMFVGGRMGRTIRMGDELPFLLESDEQVLTAIRAVMQWFSDNAHGKQRLGAVIDRVGIDSLAQYVQAAIQQQR